MHTMIFKNAINKLTRITFLFLLLPFQFVAQEKEFIYGILLDSNTREPVVFATIRIQGKSRGVITNLDGGFKIPNEFQFQEEVLEISSMGYETKIIETVSLKIEEINTILMNPALEELEEVVVVSKKSRPLTAKRIIRQALKGIPENYPKDSFSLVGYYRDYQLQKNEYLNFNEAIVQIFDNGFKSDHFKETQYGLLSYVKNKDMPQDSFAAKPYDYTTRDKFVPNAILSSRYRANELVNLCIHNAIRNYETEAHMFVGELVNDFIGAHRFTLLNNTSYKGEPVYKIGIKKKLFPYTVVGNIYIDKENYAIRKLAYSVYGKSSENRYYIPDAAYDKDKNELLFEVLVEYTREQNKMFLNYISLHNKFILLRPALFKITNIVPYKEEGLLDIVLSAPGINYEALELRDFTLKFEGQRLKITEILSAFENRITLKLSETESQIALREKLFSMVNDSKKVEMNVKIKKLEDEFGHKLDERNVENLHQFREFFTQRVISEDHEKPAEENLVIKRKPLNHADQPIAEANESDDYWMNTPLKPLKE